MRNPELLSTKVLPEDLQQKLQAAGIALTTRELIAIRPILTREKWEELQPLFQQPEMQVAFTSASSVAAIQPYIHPYVNAHPLNWSIWCLSGRTREALEGLDELPGTILATADDAATLGNKIAAAKPKQLVFFCGNQRREELPQRLREAGIDLREVVVYETIEKPVALDRQFDAVLFFSPSGVRSFFAANQLKEGAVGFAIGGTTAEALRSFTNNEMIISEQPLLDVLVDEVLRYYKQRR